MELVFSSAGHAPYKRFNAWREGVCDCYTKIDMKLVDQSDYVGTIHKEQFGPISLTVCNVPPQHIIRTPIQAARSERDFLYIGFSLFGTQSILQRGVEVYCGGGYATMFFASEAYELKNLKPARSIYVEVSRADLQKRFGNETVPTTRAIRTTTGLGMIAEQLCRSVASGTEHYREEVRRALGEELLDVVGLAFSTQAADDDASVLGVQQISERQHLVCSYIEEHLSNPLLNPLRVARATGMSVRSLHYLFKTMDTSAMDYIWTRRLLRCRHALETGLPTITITEIALSAGFNSLSHFSSAFRKHYGTSPSLFRERGKK